MKRPPILLGHAPMACHSCGATPHRLEMARAGWTANPCRCSAICTVCTLAEPIALAVAGAALLRGRTK